MATVPRKGITYVVSAPGSAVSLFLGRLGALEPSPSLSEMSHSPSLMMIGDETRVTDDM